MEIYYVEQTNKHMPVKIIFRTSSSSSLFREYLIKLITSPIGDSLILCSGYIWEPGLEENTYKILDDDLMKAIKTGCSTGIIVTVAGKLTEPLWKEHYRNFTNRLRDENVRIQSFIAPRRNWHAKLAIRLNKNIPIAALIGSSNLTGPAYRVNWRNWNFECDTLIWPSNPELNTYYRSNTKNKDIFGDLDLIIDPSIQQLNEQEQLQGLLDDINTGGLERYDAE